MGGLPTLWGETHTTASSTDVDKKAFICEHNFISRVYYFLTLDGASFLDFFFSVDLGIGGAGAGVLVGAGTGMGCCCIGG